MVSNAIRVPLQATGHVARWLVWQSMRVSLIDDLPAPRPPAEEALREAA
jgi:hypothetical protein